MATLIKLLMYHRNRHSPVSTLQNPETSHHSPLTRVQTPDTQLVLNRLMWEREQTLLCNVKILYVTIVCKSLKMKRKLAGFVFAILISVENVWSNKTMTEKMCDSPKEMFQTCLKDMPQHLKDSYLSTHNLPITNDDITGRCKVFNIGMECVITFINKCMEEDNRNIIENEVYGANRLFNHLCKDEQFRSAYLRHGECFSHIKDDWMKCSTQFKSIISEEIGQSFSEEAVNTHYMQFCCARFAYETCVFTSAKFKCRQDSARFSRVVAKMLSSEKHFSHCEKFEGNFCSICNGLSPAIHLITLLGLSLLLARI